MGGVAYDQRSLKSISISFRHLPVMPPVVLRLLSAVPTASKFNHGN